VRKPRVRSQGNHLSIREREVLWLLAEGHTAPVIATKLSLSPPAVEAHRTAAMRKLALRTDTELVRYVLRQAVQSDQGFPAK
jgi:DNA-binding CsgD family transcriptional regulator